MRLSSTLSGYISRHFLASFLALFFVFLLVILMFDAIELLRRSAAKPHITFQVVLGMAFLKLPYLGQQMFPFAVLFGAMVAFWRLTRNHELVVARAAGVSAWQFLLPVLFLAFSLGLLKVAALNPLSAALLSRYERIETLEFKGQIRLLALSQGGLWLRQANENGQSVIHASHVFQQANDVELRDVIIFIFEGKDQFVGRIDAEHAQLEDGFWHLQKAWTSKPEAEVPEFQREYWIATDLTLDKIQDSFATPETMSFWDLPEFIDPLEKAGFSAIRHRLHWHTLLATPLLMCAMVLIAATFTLRHARRSGATFVIAGGVFAGFLLYFFSDVVFALGLSNSIPLILAAWTPSGVSTLLGLAMLLHLEDG